jgi:septal ring factor EnvC (AmiA/AmiB activator)
MKKCSIEKWRNFNMRILHTADWHIGAKTDDLDRFEEQKEALKLQKEYNSLKSELETLKEKIRDTKGDLMMKKKIITDFKESKK